ncbi:MAG TPA: prolyl oligopeptidase family serine peptidase [Caulifigura sp.]|nr:prolyl oligopeptidase family serine peptidase [Caulifigura sp.]
MSRSRFGGVLVVLGLLFSGAVARGEVTPGYKQPADELVKIIDAPTSESVILSPDHQKMLLMDRVSWPSISFISRPFLKLAGTRVDPEWSTVRRTSQYTELAIQDVAVGSKPKVISTLPGLQTPVWAPDGKRFAFTVDGPGGMQLWIGDAADGSVRPVPNIRLTDVMGSAVRWTAGGKGLLVRLVPAERGAPPTLEASTEAGPVIQESLAQKARASTYQDLLKSPHDEALFDYYAPCQLATIDLETLKVTTVGKPGIVTFASVSPDGQYMRLTRLKKPYSYRVPASRFPRTTELIELATGKTLKSMSDITKPQFTSSNGVPTGGRAHEWNPLAPASLIWLEAMDGGDPENKARYRDRIMSLDAPFDGEPKEVCKLTQRISDVDFTTNPGEVMITESSASRGWQTVTMIRLEDPAGSRRVLFDLSSRDAYRDPGRPVRTMTADGQSVILKEGDLVYYTGVGSTPEGDYPFLDQLNVETGELRRMFRSPPSSYETFVAFLPGDHSRVITNYQDPKSPPNYFIKKLVEAGAPVKLAAAKVEDDDTPPPPPVAVALDAKTDTDRNGRDSDDATRRRTRKAPPPHSTIPVPAVAETIGAITNFADPHPQVTSCTKQLLTYERGDGVPLSATLYLPPGYDAASGQKLPVIVHAYPREYSSAETAGQVRGSPYKFTRFYGASPVMFLTQGYAVMMDTAMPVVGSSRKMNDTFVEQITADAEAAKKKIVDMGIGDPDRMLVTGHSYGAFMTANLLAHTELFATGIACSGAYNRTLTPFGFQNEPRTYWEATETYAKMSPFNFAHKLKEPILLIHGQADNNSGTFPIQSERFYEAVAGTGGTARLVLLPHESHSYASRESILHQLAEMTAWADKYVKNRKLPTKSEDKPKSSDVNDSPAKPAAADAAGAQ